MLDNGYDTNIWQYIDSSTNRDAKLKVQIDGGSLHPLFSSTAEMTDLSRLKTVSSRDLMKLTAFQSDTTFEEKIVLAFIWPTLCFIFMEVHGLLEDGVGNVFSSCKCPDLNFLSLRESTCLTRCALQKRHVSHQQGILVRMS